MTLYLVQLAFFTPSFMLFLRRFERMKLKVSMHQERVAPDVLALARAHILTTKYKIPLDGSGEDLLSHQHNALKQQTEEQPPYKLQEAWSAEGKPGICPQFFVAEMFAHWVGLGNVVTRKLERLWFAMAETFNGLLVAKAGDPWLILSPETGTGKTQGSCVYAALSGLYAETGILFTTRLTSQCDSVVKDIQGIAESHRSQNPKGGRFGVPSSPIAVTIHSEQSVEDRPSDEDIHNAPCLVITHERMSQIYKAALENEGGCDKGTARFDAITRWRNGLRIRVTDETPSGLVEHFKLDWGAFKALKFFLDDNLPAEAKSQLELVGCIEKACHQYWEAFKQSDEHEGAMVVALGDFLPKEHHPQKFTLQELFRAVREAPDTSSSVSKETISGLKEDAIFCLYALQHIANSWAVSLSNLEGKPAATSAWLIAPPDNMPMCVLDATASLGPFWGVLGAKVKHVKIERSIRDYRTVTAHLKVLDTGVGKEAFKKHGREWLKEVLGYFKAEASHRDHKRRVLLCVPKVAKSKHKELLATRDDGVTALHVPDYLEDLKVGHWNALDGRNEFRECDTVVVLSWTYPPRNLPIDLVFAATDRANWSDDYLKSTKEFRKELSLGHVGASIIQAVNRVRCRKVTSEDGSCEPTDIFMLMPKETSQDTKFMRETLEREMPNMVFRDWDILKPKEPKKPKVKKGSQVDRFLDYLRDVDEGVQSILVSEALYGLGVLSSGQKDIRKKLNDPENVLCKHVASMGWTYEVVRQGQRDVPVLTKDQP